MQMQTQTYKAGRVGEVCACVWVGERCVCVCVCVWVSGVCVCVCVGG